DVEIATMINEFKPIDVKELPQAVQDAIKENYHKVFIKKRQIKITIIHQIQYISRSIKFYSSKM
ncbi:hypothetical protein PZH42_29080, partial [Bacteroides cellulosilyticus]|nr:hypothetical protein [Bacteroides cellulosilyticus]